MTSPKTKQTSIAMGSPAPTSKKKTAKVTKPTTSKAGNTSPTTKKTPTKSTTLSAKQASVRKAEKAAVRNSSKATPTKSMSKMTKSDVKPVKMSALPKGTVQKPPRPPMEMDYKTGKPMAQAKMQAKRKTTGRKSRK